MNKQVKAILNGLIKLDNSGAFHMDSPQDHCELTRLIAEAKKALNKK